MPVVRKKRVVAKGKSTRPTTKPAARKAATPTTSRKPTRTAPTKPSARKPTKPTTPRKAAASKGKVKEVPKPKTKPTTGRTRTANLDETTGFTVGSDSHVIATELLKGGGDRQEVIDRCKNKLPGESRNGTPKPVTNMVGSTLSKMKDRGYHVESSWQLMPPTRASKARATRERKKREAARS